MQLKFSKKFLITGGVFALSILIILLTRTVPMSQLWKGYKLVYVKSEKLTEQNILTVLEKNQCRNIIANPLQLLPVYSKIAPVQVQSETSWLNRRTAFFTDSTASYKVFYVPDSQTSQIEKALDELNCFSDTLASVDGSATFPWISPIITLIFAAALFYYSRKKSLFATAALPVIVFAFARPLYTCCGAALLFLFADFLLQNLYGRRGFFKDLKNSVYIIPLVVSPVFFLIFSSFGSSILYILTVAASWSLVLFLEEVNKMLPEKKEKPGFNFVFIKGSSAIRIFSRQNLILCSSISLCTILLLIFSAIFSGISSAADFEERPYLPAPVSTSKTSSLTLPDLDDFMDWSWYTMSFPYRKLGSQPLTYERGETVYIKDYGYSSSGELGSAQTKVLTYDSSFESSIYDKVNQLDYPSLEKMMIRQGKHSNYAYTKNTGSTSEKAVTFVLLFFTVLPVLLCLYFLTGKLRNDFSL